MFDQLSSGANQGAQRASTGPLLNYARLDPMLGIESIGLDDIESMLSLQTRIGSLIREDELFNRTADTCAWKLIASTFFAEAHRKKGDSLSLQMCCRLNETERDRIRTVMPELLRKTVKSSKAFTMTRNLCLRPHRFYSIASYLLHRFYFDQSRYQELRGYAQHANLSLQLAGHYPPPAQYHPL